MAVVPISAANITEMTISGGYLKSRGWGALVYMWDARNSSADGTQWIWDDALFVHRLAGGAWQETLISVWEGGGITLGGYDPPSNSPGRVLGLLNTTAPTNNLGGAQIYASGGEAKVRDSAGNVTTFSPHHFDQITLDADDTYPVVLHHQNHYIGKEETIYLSKMARLVEQLTGEKLIWSRDMPPSERRDFDADEEARKEASQQRIAAHRERVAQAQALPPSQRAQVLATMQPEPKEHTPRNVPKWMKDRIQSD